MEPFACGRIWSGPLKLILPSLDTGSCVRPALLTLRHVLASLSLLYRYSGLSSDILKSCNHLGSVVLRDTCCPHKTQSHASVISFRHQVTLRRHFSTPEEPLCTNGESERSGGRARTAGRGNGERGERREEGGNSAPSRWSLFPQISLQAEWVMVSGPAADGSWLSDPLPSQSPQIDTGRSHYRSRQSGMDAATALPPPGGREHHHELNMARELGRAEEIRTTVNQERRAIAVSRTGRTEKRP